MTWEDEVAFSRFELNPLRRAILHTCAGLVDGELIPLFLLRETLHPDHRSKLEGAVEALVKQGLLAEAESGFGSIQVVSFTPLARRFLGEAARSEAVQAAIKTALTKCLHPFKASALAAHQPADLRKLELLEPHLRYITTTALRQFKLKLAQTPTQEATIISDGLEVALLLTLFAEALAILGHAEQSQFYLTQAQKLAALLSPPPPFLKR
jgi:hypothetical protein